MDNEVEAYLGRVERTFAFIDLSGFTRFTSIEGDERAVMLLALFRRCVRESAARRSVRIAKWLGDGAMLVGSEADRVALTALEVAEFVNRSSPLPLRGGIATGPVILFEGDDYIGDAVNLAARLADVAGPGEVVSDQRTSDVACGVVTCDPLGLVPVEGLATPVRVYRLHLGSGVAGVSGDAP
ncbi:MAG: adenylate/guanylate cyclase domain-containing protein [Acidimicrobiales bacterium]